MRAIWKGAITFGLVNVPVKLFSATESHDIALHQVHDADGGRIRYQRRCEKCGEVVQYSDIDKAYDDGERTVVLTEDDLASLPVERSREIDVIEFVPTEQIDPIMMQSAYYLAPDSKSSKSYVLLRRTLEETDRTAVVTFTLRQKTRLGALRVRDGVLVLQGLLWEDEVRQADFDIDDSVKISSKEMEMSAALVSSFESDFEPAAFTDEYQVELQQLIQAKLEQGEAIDTEATFGAAAASEEEGGEVLDLMEALRRSVAASRGKRAQAADDGEAAEEAEDEAEEEVAETGTESARPRRSGGRGRAAATDDESAPAGTSKTATKKSSGGTRATSSGSASGKDSSASGKDSSGAGAKSSTTTAKRSTASKSSKGSTTGKAAGGRKAGSSTAKDEAGTSKPRSRAKSEKKSA